MIFISFFLSFTISYCINFVPRQLQRSLGEAGEIEPETEGMLIENGIDFDEFPQEVGLEG